MKYLEAHITLCLYYLLGLSVFVATPIIISRGEYLLSGQNSISSTHLLSREHRCFTCLNSCLSVILWCLNKLSVIFWLFKLCIYVFCLICL